MIIEKPNNVCDYCGVEFGSKMCKFYQDETAEDPQSHYCVRITYDYSNIAYAPEEFLPYTTI